MTPASRPEPATGIGSELLTVVARLNRLASQRTGISLPWAQARLLGTIEDRGAARISELAELDHCSQPTMTTQVRRLEAAGLVARTADPEDARAVRIGITAKGSAVLARVRADRAAVIDPYIAGLPKDQRDVLAEAIRAMRRLVDDISAGGSHPDD